MSDAHNTFLPVDSDTMKGKTLTVLNVKVVDIPEKYAGHVIILVDDDNKILDVYIKPLLNPLS
ncbi:hypothetical protein R2980_002774 [Klebsiella oxytoca]|nr:hypothetical protein [Klebsiella oxytoca]HCB1754729.1 hypothetical protein [Klebsiella oxytoca]HCB1761174.1 hypothetical protein [Klebsiella oxytoca]HCB1842194.1 hypothetical protein [Klebsiella oxytoca]HCB1897196.1 hypothetical protein [Klebsiella oxytoca]